MLERDVKCQTTRNDRTDESYITVDNIREYYVDTLYARNRYQTKNDPRSDRAYITIHEINVKSKSVQQSSDLDCILPQSELFCLLRVLIVLFLRHTLA